MKWFQNSFHNSLTWNTDNATHVTLTQRSRPAWHETSIILVACPAPSCLNTPVLSFAQLLSHSVYNLFHQQLLWSLCHHKQPDTGELAPYSGASSPAQIKFCCAVRPVQVGGNWAGNQNDTLMYQLDSPGCAKFTLPMFSNETSAWNICPMSELCRRDTSPSFCCPHHCLESAC